MRVYLMSRFVPGQSLALSGLVCHFSRVPVITDTVTGISRWQSVQNPFPPEVEKRAFVE